MTQLSAVAADLGQREEALDLGQRALAVVDDVDDALEAARLFVWFGLSLAVIDADVTPKLALATIDSVVVLGALHASPAVKAALAGRIH